MKTSWNKGLTKEIDKRVKKISDFNKKYPARYWLGKKRSKSTKEKVSAFLRGKTGTQSRHWKGGRRIVRGYAYIYSPHHPFRTTNNTVLEQKLVLEKIIGRYIKPTEAIHHINKVRTDNRPENLMLFPTHGLHSRFEWGKSIKPEQILFDGRKYDTLSTRKY